MEQEKTRFEARLSKEQKILFKKATLVGGYSSLSDFVLKAAREKANQIIAKSEEILASQRDSEIFFKAITNPMQANNLLKSATDEYNTIVSE